MAAHPIMVDVLIFVSLAHQWVKDVPVPQNHLLFNLMDLLVVPVSLVKDLPVPQDHLLFNLMDWLVVQISLLKGVPVPQNHLLFNLMGWLVVQVSLLKDVPVPQNHLLFKYVHVGLHTANFIPLEKKLILNKINLSKICKLL